jgi:hypothetical protein
MYSPLSLHISISALFSIEENLISLILDLDGVLLKSSTNLEF